MQSNTREAIGVIGGSGFGKTRFMQGINPTRVINLTAGFADEKEFPGEEVRSFDEFHAFMERHHRGLFRVNWPAPPQFFPEVCQWALLAGGCWVRIDEADRYLSNDAVQTYQDIKPHFKELSKRGRHAGQGEGVSFILAADNPFDFPIWVRRQVTTWIIFNTGEPSDLDYLAKIVGRENAEKIIDFPAGRYMKKIRGVPGVTEHDLPPVGRHEVIGV